MSLSNSLSVDGPFGFYVKVPTSTSMALFAWLILPSSVKTADVPKLVPQSTANRDGRFVDLGGYTSLCLAERAQLAKNTETPVAGLNKILATYPSMSVQVQCARSFIAALPSWVRQPVAWTDGETEVVFEWIFEDKHAVVSFDEDGEFGYTMRSGTRFVPGASIGLGPTAPDDLLAYLA
jgi:hypothetical protein